MVRGYVGLSMLFIKRPLLGYILGAKSGPSYHERYFQLKNFSEEQRKQYVKQRQGAYTRYVRLLMP